MLKRFRLIRGLSLLAATGLVGGLAHAANCSSTYQAASGRLTIDAIVYGGVRYTASLTAPPGTTSFSLEAATASPGSDCSNPATYDGAAADFPNVVADGQAYTARLALVAGSNPPQFALAGATPIVVGAGSLVGSTAMAAWDALPPDERNRVTSWNSLFVHQSVGQDIEDGATSNGYKPEYFGPGMIIGSTTNIYGGLFEGISNGDPLPKFAYFRTNALANKSRLRVAAFKFGYADVESSTLGAVQAGYKAMVDELKSNGIRVMHVTPPLVYDVAYNTPKMQLRTWMQQTFPNDVIFDLQDIESRTGTTGARCEENGVWRICEDVRSTPACPSKGQGTDTVGQGHLCFGAATKISKAFLYSIYLSGK